MEKIKDKRTEVEEEKERKNGIKKNGLKKNRERGKREGKV